MIFAVIGLACWILAGILAIVALHQTKKHHAHQTVKYHQYRRR